MRKLTEQDILQEMEIYDKLEQLKNIEEQIKIRDIIKKIILVTGVITGTLLTQNYQVGLTAIALIILGPILKQQVTIRS